jgi:hypothetical protein
MHEKHPAGAILAKAIGSYTMISVFSLFSFTFGLSFDDFEPCSIGSLVNNIFFHLG